MTKFTTNNCLATKQCKSILAFFVFFVGVCYWDEMLDVLLGVLDILLGVLDDDDGAEV